MSYFPFSVSQLKWFLSFVFSLIAEMIHVYYKKSEIINTKKEKNVYPPHREL